MIKNLHITDLQTFQNCRRQFYYEKIARLTLLNDGKSEDLELSPETDPEFYFTFGEAGHKTLADFYSYGRVPEESWKEYSKNFSEDMQELGAQLFREYWEVYKTDLEEYEILLVEVPIEVELHGHPIELTIDALIKSKANGAVFAMDHKFYSSLPSSDELRMRDQFTGYTAAIRKAGYHIDGVIANICRKYLIKMPKMLANGKLSTDKSQATTYALYKQFMDALKQGGQDVSYAEDTLEYYRVNPHPLFRREFILKSTKETNTWWNTAQFRMQDILDSADSKDRCYPNPQKHCLKCKFLQLCQANLQGGSGQGIIDTMFRLKDDDER
jgi:hypothetical protein